MFSSAITRISMAAFTESNFHTVSVM